VLERGKARGQRPAAWTQTRLPSNPPDPAVRAHAQYHIARTIERLGEGLLQELWAQQLPEKKGGLDIKAVIYEVAPGERHAVGRGGGGGGGG
jgi:hypothetical protein